MLALLIDLAAILAATFGISTGLGALSLLSKDFAGAIVALLFFVVSAGYGIAFEWFWHGRTLGKRVMQLRVVDARGLRLGFPQVLIRNLLRAVDSLPLLYLVGGMVSILNARMQRLGDIAAGTIVVKTQVIAIPQLPPEAQARQNSLRAYRTLYARLRQKVEPAHASIALDALRRRDALEPEDRLKVFAEIAAGLKTAVEFPEEATLYLTDEQYVWNVVEILFER